MKIYLFLLSLTAFIHTFMASSEHIEEVFLKNEIVPDIVNAAPKKVVYVSFS